MAPHSQGTLGPLLLAAALVVCGSAQNPSPASAKPIAPGPVVAPYGEYARYTSFEAPSAQPAPSPPTSDAQNISQASSSAAGSQESFVQHGKFSLPKIDLIPGFNVSGEDAQAETAPTPLSGFVSTSGQNFVVNGSVHFFPGSNDYFLILRNYLSDDEVRLFFRVMAGNGIQLVRTWAFLNGEEDPRTLNGTIAIQPELGVYNEESLQRLDLILAEAGKNGIRIIFPFVNYWDDLGGMQWYVDQVLGKKGQDLESFYMYPSIITAFKKYVLTILTRMNTITGVKYYEDPTIFALELANEPHTTDGFEEIRGLAPGSLIRRWMKEIVEFIRLVDTNHMIAGGEEGWRVDGGVNSSWIENGTKGDDFAGNVELFDFATVHLYPGNWDVPSYVAKDFAEMFVNVRAKIAKALNKPFILEETGKDLKYPVPRPQFLRGMFSVGERAGASAIMPWELVAWHVNPNASGGFDFGIDDASFGPVSEMVTYMNKKTKTCDSGTCPSSDPPCMCFDIPPTGSNLTCVQQVGYNSNCTEAWLGPGTCDLSCGRCDPCNNHDYCNYCVDSPPDQQYTCPQQLAIHPNLCSLPFSPKGTCDVTCNRCTPCPAPGGPQYCQANVEVGPSWNISASSMGVKQQIILSAPGPTKISAPYNLTVTGPGDFSTLYLWEWNTTATVSKKSSGDMAVTGLVTAPYNALLPNSSNAITVGSIDMTDSLSAVFPSSVAVNGVPCGLVVSSYSAEQ